MTVQIPNAADEQHTKQVMSEMKELGTPDINVVWTGEHYVAIGGSHRVTAAYRLGIEPDWNDITEHEGEIEIDGEELDMEIVWDFVDYVEGPTVDFE